MSGSGGSGCLRARVRDNSGSCSTVRRSKLLDPSQGKTSVSVVAGGLCRYGLAFRASICKFGIVEVNCFAPSLKIA
eukprot:5008251-Pleurochrysis_carterae.AAC.1